MFLYLKKFVFNSKLVVILKYQNQIKIRRNQTLTVEMRGMLKIT